MKEDRPPLRMIVGAGKLTPADAYSAERLESFRHGTTMIVQPVVNSQSKLRRKYWAILAAVVANCDVPWKTVKQASDALKRTLGVIEEGMTITGAPVVYPGSFNDLQEPEFEEFFEGAMLLLQRATGIDPETLSKQAPEEEQESSAAESPTKADAGSGDDGSRSPDSASAAAALSPALKGEAVTKFLALATDEALTSAQRLRALDSTRADWTREMPDDAAFFKACWETARRVANSETTASAAKRYLSALTKCKPKEDGDAK